MAVRSESLNSRRYISALAIWNECRFFSNARDKETYSNRISISRSSFATDNSRQANCERTGYYGIDLRDFVSLTDHPERLGDPKGYSTKDERFDFIATYHRIFARFRNATGIEKRQDIVV
jgi:hypothetical protein